MVAVNVHQPGDDVESLHFGGLSGRRRGDVGGDAHDFSLPDRHIAHAVNLVRRIDDVAARQEQIVGSCCPARGSR